MRMRDTIRKSFQPEIFIKVGRMKDGEVVPELLQKIREGIDSTYDVLVDTEAGVIYLKKKKKGGK